MWNKTVFGNVHQLVSQDESNLQNIQNQIQTNGHTDTLIQQEKKAQGDLDLALNKEETFWFEKSKVKWNMEGDRNTAYFHRVTKIKNTTKLITLLRDGEHTLTDPNQIANHALTMIPSNDEIKQAVFSLNNDSAPGPDGFGSCFYQIYWDIVKEDVIKAVLQFFNTGWILPNFNANTLILIPKTQNADSMDQFRPIAMANFKFKIISKILADRLAQIMPNIVSQEQRGFIQGRNIKDCVCLASEAINMLDQKSFGGNLAFKVDISKAFDTLNWKFLLKVLKQFGFSETFCNWIDAILQSAKLSICINGSQQGYFSCSRGVRQGDPLSPLLFCLAEDVLSRSLTKLVEQGKLKQMRGTRNCLVPSHILYADDIMIFCNGGISDARLQQLINVIGFNKGSFPFNYLGVPIFKGKPKARFLQPIVDKIKTKLSNWKASILSIAGRVQLIKSVAQSMLIHTITIYDWPSFLLKELETCFRNFIWSGDITKRKLVTVAWKKLCKPQSQGGLGIRSLSQLNAAGNLKLCWDMLHS
uniref:RNA-directed DNA polymerase (Reverse transcriptase) n=1 Tax=Medicago truncatula TaxID=3880 RepID=A2Q6D4_MEDTR|nr:RNA-directed DNA polymerase (Reverse transcriptase) [Medicago truncatula]